MKACLTESQPEVEVTESGRPTYIPLYKWVRKYHLKWMLKNDIYEVYCCLAEHQNNFTHRSYPGNRGIARYANIGHEKVVEALAMLENRGLIRKANEPTRRRATVWEVVQKPENAVIIKPKKKSVTASGEKTKALENKAKYTEENTGKSLQPIGNKNTYSEKPKGKPRAQQYNNYNNNNTTDECAVFNNLSEEEMAGIVTAWRKSKEKRNYQPTKKQLQKIDDLMETISPQELLEAFNPESEKLGWSDSLTTFLDRLVSLIEQEEEKVEQQRQWREMAEKQEQERLRKEQEFMKRAIPFHELKKRLQKDIKKLESIPSASTGTHG